MKILTFEGGFDKNLCYLIWCPDTGKAGLIDTSVKPEPILEAIQKNDLTLEKIIITHSHTDHILYSNQFAEHSKSITFYGHTKLINSINSGKYHGLSHGADLKLGNDLLTVLHTPGHFPDSICIWNEAKKILFTGDTVFVGRTGRVIGNMSNISHLYQSVYHIIHQLPKNTLIYPGHNYGDCKFTTIGRNIQTSPFFKCKNLAEFSSVMDKFEKNRS
ncbi:MAG: MBL fold metallo-hydrolase [Fidelibacterota bacterium]